MATDAATTDLVDPAMQQLVAGIGSRFVVAGDFLLGEQITTGHINSTYRATYRQADGSCQRYVIQAVNSHVFKDPRAVMANVERVTNHINTWRRGLPDEAGGQALRLVSARAGGAWFEDAQGVVWRCYNHIEGCVTYDVVATPGQAYQAARAFGSFQQMVSDLDPASLIETIPDFHHTPKRLAKLLDVAATDRLGRLAAVREEFEFILRREAITGCLLELASAGQIPRRITHNDTKINNVMIDALSDEAVCVIDLDTVMPGLALYDFGDLVRSATSPAAEDTPDLTKVAMRLPIFEALVAGYLQTAGDFLNVTEVEHLVLAGKLITLELGIRFLTDHLAGDVYFMAARPGHNLDRCRTQLQLVRSIEDQEAAMMAVVRQARQSRR